MNGVGGQEPGQALTHTPTPGMLAELVADLEATRAAGHCDDGALAEELALCILDGEDSRLRSLS